MKTIQLYPEEKNPVFLITPISGWNSLQNVTIYSWSICRSEKYTFL